MRNKQFTVTAAEINSLAVIEINPIVTVSETGLSGLSITRTYKPIDIQIINDCGAMIAFNAILTEREYNEYVAGSTFYALQRVPKGGVVQPDHTNFPSCYRILIQGLEATAASDLIIECINYQEI